MYYMVSNRVLKNGTLTSEIGTESYWTSDGLGPVDQLASWTKAEKDEFQKALVRATGKFPQILDPENHEEQRHVGVFVHGFNNSWGGAAVRYKGIADDLYAANDLGICVLFTWPSNGAALGYIPDRLDARRSADSLAGVLSDLYDWAIQKQVDGSRDPKKGCRAKISLIAHSMGAYVTQKAMQTVWTRKNKPLLVSLINQMLLVAADVDNDLFSSGEAVDNSDGDAVANLCYRITALYTGRDSTLGLSAGFKHFGKRRLGRSGLAGGEPDNVWAVDCSALIDPKLRKVHSSYFNPTESQCGELMRQVLRGDDRTLIATWVKGPV